MAGLGEAAGEAVDYDGLERGLAHGRLRLIWSKG